MALRDLEEEAIAIGRGIARDASSQGLPVSAGAMAMLTAVVRNAHQEGYDKAVREVVAAYGLFIETDDLDGFRDAITEMMPEAGR